MARMHTVRGLARLAGVSVRMLHHYDAIGLLQPCERARNGYRLYGQSELLRLSPETEPTASPRWRPSATGWPCEPVASPGCSPQSTPRSRP